MKTFWRNFFVTVAGTEPNATCVACYYQRYTAVGNILHMDEQTKDLDRKQELRFLQCNLMCVSSQDDL